MTSQSRFREFGGRGGGGAVEKQLARDKALLKDIRGALRDVWAFDHSRGVSETASSVVSRDRVASVDTVAIASSLDQLDTTSGSALPVMTENKQQPGGSLSITSSTPAITATTVSHENANNGKRPAVGGNMYSSSSNSLKLVEDKKCADEATMVDRIPVVLGRDAGRPSNHGCGDGDEHLTKQALEQEKPLNRPPIDQLTSGFHGNDSANSEGRVGRNNLVSSTSSEDGGNIAAVANPAESRGRCGSLGRKDERAAPVDLTDDERMSMLQHVRPSVFGEPAFGRLRGLAIRPRSAAATSPSRWGSHRDSPHLHRAATAGPRSQERQPRNNRKQDWDAHVNASKLGGILDQDGWVREKILSHAPMPTVASSNLRESQHYGTGGGCGGCDRAPSFVRSIAFGVNMGKLEEISGTTLSATTAVAFASAAGKIPPSIVSTSWFSPKKKSDERCEILAFRE